MSAAAPPGAEQSGCAVVDDDLALLALGVLTGRARAGVLEHLEACPRCRAHLARLLGVADALATIAPPLAPPTGFAHRCARRIADAPDRARPEYSPRRRTVLAGAVLVLLVALGVGIAALRAGSPAPVRTAHATFPAAHGGARAIAGEPAHLVVTLTHLGGNEEVTCVVETVAGVRATLGGFWLTRGEGEWSVPLPVPADALARITVLGPDGATLTAARFSR